MEYTPVVVFSHLRWNSVFQRPHHIMTRLAERRDILFVEEPVTSSAVAGLEVMRVAPRVRVVQPHLPVEGPGFGPRQERILSAQLSRFLEREGYERFVAWLYTPMAVSVARGLNPAAIVYDCMDELSHFLHAPAEIQAREHELFECADAVFTGGPSLYRAKQRLHPYVHCFPGSVDVKHFASAASIPDAREQARFPHPRLGFLGVIDDRMDLDILRHLAAQRPRWTFVMVGPVAKIERSALPWGANLRYMGQQPYHDLPGYLAGWDVCIVPFARNDATRFNSPTKVLEYMAADRPIVSTSIEDVAEPYGDIVFLGDGPEGFLRACERALDQSEAERASRRALAREVLARTSWDETVDRMDAIVRRVAGDSAHREAPAYPAASVRSIA
ncbi:MAG TPA: glycosyltransferase [Candidatus Omnitrophota bacterium]|nr:glycosyltransferase [Candidatus Omnitrophota bacterium]